jgi:chromosome segregation ATPase
MKWALDQIKTALRDKAQRRSVKELVQSGTRSVRVISEEKIYQLIQAVVTDTLGDQAQGMDDEDRSRIVEQAKERLDRVLKDNTAAESRGRRQQETIHSYQRQVERLESERVALLEQAQDLNERASQLEQEGANASTAREELEQVRRELEQMRSERDAARAASQETERRSHDASEEALAAMRSELGELKQALSHLSEQQPQGIDQRQLDEAISRLAHHEQDATKLLEERFASSMDRVLDQVGRTLRAATAKPIDRPVEATEAMLTKVFERESDMESNIGDLGVSERSSQRSINRSLERLRAARGGKAGTPAGDDETPAQSTDANGVAGARKPKRRKGMPERRRSRGSRSAASERRKGTRDRRKTNQKIKTTRKGKTSGKPGTAGGSRRKP